MRFNLPAVSLLLLMSVLTLTVTQVSVAKESIAKETDVVMKIKPRVCQVAKVGDVCQMTINIAWQSLLPINTCLYQNKNKTLCWHNQRSAESQLAVKLVENALFTLTSTQNEENTVLAQQLVSVNSAQPQKYRRRLRADWSLF